MYWLHTGRTSQVPVYSLARDLGVLSRSLSTPCPQGVQRLISNLQRPLVVAWSDPLLYGNLLRMVALISMMRLRRRGFVNLVALCVLRSIMVIVRTLVVIALLLKMNVLRTGGRLPRCRRVYFFTTIRSLVVIMIRSWVVLTWRWRIRRRLSVIERFALLGIVILLTI